MSDIEEKMQNLVLHLLGHEDKKLRASSLQNKLQDLTADEIVEIIHIICTKAKGKSLPYLKVYNTLPEVLQSFINNHEKIYQIRVKAREKDYSDVLQMLVDLPPKKDGNSSLATPEDPLLKDLSLGERKSLSKTHQTSLLKRMLREQNPAVIRSLLLNPRLTEADVLKIASLKPTSSRVLEEIFRNSKWIARYRVKRALISNPYCVPSIALYLLKFMFVTDLKDISQDENLHFAVKDAADQLLKEKA
jgi:hypothetical protein